MSTHFGSCSTYSAGAEKGMRVIIQQGRGELVLNEAEARRLLDDLRRAVEHAWPSVVELQRAGQLAEDSLFDISAMDRRLQNLEIQAVHGTPVELEDIRKQLEALERRVDGLECAAVRVGLP